eukprot:270976-Amphidinium_carterae.1
MAVDPKASAFKFHCQNGPRPLHHFGKFGDILTSGKAFCKIHNGDCKVPKKPSCFIAGFPCAPFSSQRSNRAAKGPEAQWHQHPEIHVWQECLRVVEVLQPECGLLENVCGFGFKGQDDKSPLEMTINTLEQKGYNARAVELNLSNFLSCTRKRIF